MMRPFLIAVLIAAWSAPAAAQNQALEITKIADGVYAAVYSEFRMDPIEGNKAVR